MCLSPWIKEDNIKASIIPCGKCTVCKAKRVSAWSFRLMQEYKQSDSAHFITLTYDTKHVPITPKGFMNINKRDLQLFFKRLRKAHPKDTKIKYYAAAEFGTKTDRPHYHIIIFNTDIDLISNAWNMGDVHFGQVSAASVGYTLKYINKPTRIPKFKGDDRTPEFALMSKRIGASYITNKMVKWHKADLENRMYCNLTDGKKITMPRYYKEKIYTENERVQISKTAQAKILDSLFEQKTNSTINDSKKIRLDDIRRQHYHANKNTNNKI